MLKSRSLYSYYLYFVILIGLALLISGVRFASFEPKANFFLLLGLAFLSQFATTSVKISDKAGITYDVGSAISIAAAPFYNPFASILIQIAAVIGAWLIKPADKTTWKRSWRQLGFNVGMHGIAIISAGIVLILTMGWLKANVILSDTLPWLLAAIVYGQVNLWLLIIVLRLQHGADVKPMQIWMDNVWALSIDAAVMSVGGGLLAFALNQFGSVAIIVFFLPILLSAYSFRLYVRQMQAHMDNLENIVAERTRELAAVMKEKDQFLAVLTHDMKTPLTSIGIYGSLLRDYPHIILEKPHMADTILRSQETLTDMVNNILDLEKLQAGDGIILDKENLDLVLLLDAVIEPLNAQASEKEIDLQYTCQPSPLIVMVDKSQMKRVLQNLISNAVKYTQKSGRVWVDAKIDNGRAVVAVNDNGYGIPKEELPYVFDRYRRVAKHRKVATGTGLGLAITKAIIEAHGGEISVASEEGKGSVFTVKLPL